MPAFDPATLTAAEQQTLTATANGEWADFTATTPDRTLRAAFLRHLLLALPATDAKPWPLRLPGLRIRGAIIAGKLDLADCTGPEGAALPVLALENCDIPDPLDLSNSRLARLSIAFSRFSHLNARHARIDGPFSFANTKPFRDIAWIFANGIAVDGDVDGSGSQLFGTPTIAPNAELRQGDALVLANAVIAGDVDVRNIALHGCLSLLGARITGSLGCAGAKLRNPGGDALIAQGSEIGGAAYLCDGFEADGSVFLLGARITSNLECDGAKLRNPGGDALIAQGAEIGGAAYLRNGFEADGGVSLLSARITGNLECDGAKLRNPGGHALLAAGAEIGGAALLRNGFAADGGVFLLGARITGSLDCAGAKLRNPGGTAFNAYNTTIAGSLLISSGASFVGQVFLAGTRIIGNCTILGAFFTNQGDNAIDATGLEVGDDLTLENVRIIGNLNLRRARIGASLTWDELQFPVPAGPPTSPPPHPDESAATLDLSHTSITGALHINALATEIKLTIDLRAASAATLDDTTPNIWGNATTSVHLDGFTYHRISLNDAEVSNTESHVRNLLAWLRQQPAFRPQPYRQLAKVLRQQGHPEEARRIAIAESDAMPSNPNPAFAFIWRCWGRGFGYGLDPMAASKTLIFCLLIGWAFIAAAQHGANVMVLSTTNVTAFSRPGKEAIFLPLGDKAGDAELPCGNQINSFFYAVDVMLPIVPLHQESKCEISTDAELHKGQWLEFWRIAKALFSILGKLITTLAIITFSGILRPKDQE